MTRPLLRRQAVEERQHGVDERLRLVDVGGVAGGRDHHLLRAGNLGGHVVGGGQERRVVGADHDQRRHLDVGQGFDHAGVALGEHAARGARQARGVAMAGAGALGGCRSARQALALEAVAGRSARLFQPSRASSFL